VPIFAFLGPALAAAAIAFAATPSVCRFARRVGAVDLPGPRKMHAAPTPLLGGLAVIVAVMAVLGAIQIAPIAGLHPLDPPLFLALALGVVPVAAVSIVDDVRPLGVGFRLAAHFAGAAIAILLGIRLGAHVHLFALDLSIGAAAIPLSALWIVGVTNAFNLVDGLDGLSAGLALIAALSLAAVSWMNGCLAMASVAGVLAGALVGFLPFNVFPARIFLGDGGATAVGFWLACLALGGGSTLSAGMAILVPILVLGVPVAETAVSMLRRLVRRGRNGTGPGVFAADREHMHHRLVARGASPRRAVLLLYGAGILAASAGLASLFLTYRAAAVLLVTLMAAAVIGVTRLHYDEFAIVRRRTLLKVRNDLVLKRALFAVFFDLGLMIGAIAAASSIFRREAAGALFEILPAVAIGTFWLVGMYRGPWRLRRRRDVFRSTSAVVLSAGAAFIACRLTMRNPAPAAFFAVEAAILFVLVIGSRAGLGLFDMVRRGSTRPVDTRVAAVSVRST